MKTSLHVQPKSTPAPSFTPVRGGLLQRKCACGGSAGLAKACGDCSNQGLSVQRSTQDPERGTQELQAGPSTVHEALNSSEQLDRQQRTFMKPTMGHSFSKMSVHAVSEPVNQGPLEFRQEAPAVFDESGNEIAEAPLLPGRPGAEGAETPTLPLDPGVATEQQTPPPPGAPPPGLILLGPRTLWYFSGESPASYTVSAVVHSNATGGTFNWTVTPELSLSANNIPAPTVTTAARSTTLNDARIRLAHTNAGTVRRAAYELTVRGPHSLTPLGITNNTIPGGWQSLVGYSIQDQFGTTLPSAVEVNEIFDSAAIPDLAGNNWYAGPQGHALVSPSGWSDNISVWDGVPPSLNPTPGAPGTGGPQVDHWPGHWQVGSPTIGSGTRVRSVTWRRFQDHGDHL
jgi:hypothetical protein